MMRIFFALAVVIKITFCAKIHVFWGITLPSKQIPMHPFKITQIVRLRKLAMGRTLVFSTY